MKRTILLLICLLLCGSAALAEYTLPIDLSGGKKPAEDAFLSDTLYEDESIRVEIQTTVYKKTNCYLAYIHIKDPSQLRTAAAYAFDRDQTAPPDAIAKRVNAVLAIGGDYCSYQLQAGSYLIRQGQMYANKPLRRRDVLLIDDQGDFIIIEPYKNGEPKEFSDDVGNIVNSFNFGPGLVIDGKRLDPEYAADFNFAVEKHRRCAICQVEKGKLDYICIVTDGSKECPDGGLTMQDLADFVMSLGVQNAYNLDGGNSTVMLFGGEKVNAIGQGYLRPISDIIYFATAVPEK